MRHKKKAMMTLLLTTSVLIVGCGSDTTIIVSGDGDTNDTNTIDVQANDTNTTEVKVIDGYILNSTVTDSDGNKAEYDREKNVYILKNLKSDYILAKGGVVDIDGNTSTEDDRRWFKTDTDADGLGDINGTELFMEAPASYSVVTPLTTLVAYYMKESNLSLVNAEKVVADMFGIYQEDINKDPYSYDDKFKDRTKIAVVMVELAKRWQHTSTLSTRSVDTTKDCLPGQECQLTTTTDEKDCLPGQNCTATTTDQIANAAINTTDTGVAETAIDENCSLGEDCTATTTESTADQMVNTTDIDVVETAIDTELNTTDTGAAETAIDENCSLGEDCTTTTTDITSEINTTILDETDATTISNIANVPTLETIIKIDEIEDFEQLKTIIDEKANSIKLDITNNNKNLVEALRDFEKEELGVITITNDMIFH